jgi:hypothetical protein
MVDIGTNEYSNSTNSKIDVHAMYCSQSRNSILIE